MTKQIVIGSDVILASVVDKFVTIVDGFSSASNSFFVFVPFLSLIVIERF